MDYRNSPHVAQWPLSDRLIRILHATLRGLAAAGLPARVLELGAGHGGYAAQALAAGHEVTAAEMSPGSLQALRARYGANDRLTTVSDPGADLSDAGDGYSLALCISVLHHIPDYLDLLDRLAGRLLPGGALLTMQDPLWYPRVGRVTRAFDRGTYLAWRIAQGKIPEGVAAMRRRLRGEYPEAEGDEIVYHHVVRQGVDEVAVVEALRERFARVELFTYWSSHLAAARRPAEFAGLVNTFGVRASGFAG